MIQWRAMWGEGAESERAEARENGGARRVPEAEADAVIGRILDTYDRRVDAESRRRERQAEERRALRRASERLLEEVIRPILGAVGEDVRERGHEWKIEERVDIQEQPAVACLFRPRPESGPGGATSELTFRCLFPGRVTTQAIVRRGTQQDELQARTYSIANVTGQVVRGEIARFLAAALEAEPEDAAAP